MAGKPASGELGLQSCIYEGDVWHCRHVPRKHSFRYRVTMVYLALDELEKVRALSPLWSDHWWSPAKFKREDFSGDPELSLENHIRSLVEEREGIKITGRIFLLANWRYWGYSMNPLSTYYCFDRDGELQAIVAEVHNTPWGERHQYVLPCTEPGNRIDREFSKTFTVSPFNPMNMRYLWKSSAPENKLKIAIDTVQDGTTITQASLSLQSVAISSKTLNLTLIRFPFMTVKIIVAIYWQAFKLLVKRVPFLGKNKVQTIVG